MNAQINRTAQRCSRLLLLTALCLLPSVVSAQVDQVRSGAVLPAGCRPERNNIVYKVGEGWKRCTAIDTWTSIPASEVLNGLSPQAGDSDLTAIAGLSPANDDILQRKSGGWTNRTPAQFKTDLVLVKGDVGLGNTDNTSDVDKPVSTLQAAADALNLKIASNLSDLNSASAARANLGGTTVGANLFTATNPSAISFPEVAADNTVSFRTPAQVLSDIGATPILNAGAALNVLADGAVAGDTGNQATAIQATLNRLSNTGGEVVIPQGTYRITSGVIVPNGTTLRGVGWKTTGGGQNGTWVHVVGTGYSPVLLAGPHASIKDVAFIYDQPTPGPGWAPTAFEFTIDNVSGADNVVVENVLLYNATSGIRIRGERAFVNQVYGHVLQTGIDIDTSSDEGRWRDIHFWPYWSGDANVLAYTLANAVGIKSARNDSPVFDGIFTYGYKYGIWFTSSANGITSKFLVDGTFDKTVKGVYVDGPGTTGVINSMQSQGDNETGSIGLHVNAADVVIQAGTIHSRRTANEGVRVEGANSTLSVDNVWLNEWNLAVAGHPGVNAVLSSNRVNLGSKIFNGGNGGADKGGAGVVDFAVPTSTTVNGQALTSNVTLSLASFSDSSANLRAALTDENGTGAILADSAVDVTFFDSGGGAALSLKATNSSSFPQINFFSESSTFRGVVGVNAATDGIVPGTALGDMVLRTEGALWVATNTNPRFSVANSGVIALNTTNYNTCTLTTVAAVVTCSSDERLKNLQGQFTRGLADVLKLNPILYKWKPDSGIASPLTYAGFSAQDVLKAIPEAVGINDNGFYTLSDRPITGALVNSIKELHDRLTHLENAKKSQPDK